MISSTEAKQSKLATENDMEQLRNQINKMTSTEIIKKVKKLVIYIMRIFLQDFASYI